MASYPSHLESLNSNSSAPARGVRKETDTADMSEKVPLVEVSAEKPPLAKEETDDDLDDRQVVTNAYPGVDDGFFNSDSDNKDEKDPDSEDIPKNDNDIPIIITSRAGGDGDSEKPDTTDGSRRPDFHPANFPGGFPYAPGFGIPDLEGSVIPDLESIPDVNVYQHKKTLAQGMMDLALFSANANQLRYVVESYNRHPYYYPSVVLISFSLILQVAIGVGLIWNATYNVKDKKEICIANKINNFTVIGIFLVTVVNVFISAFGVAGPLTT